MKRATIALLLVAGLVDVPADVSAQDSAAKALGEHLSATVTEEQAALPIRIVPNRAWRPVHYGDEVRGVKGPNGRFAACLTRVTGEVYVLDLNDTRPAWIIPAPKDLGPIAGLAFSRDGWTLAMPGPQGGMLLDLKHDRLTRAPWLAGAPAAFSPDDEVLWVADGAAEMWMSPSAGKRESVLRCFTHEGKQVKSLPLAMNLPGRITFADNGRTLIVEGAMGHGLAARHGGWMEPMKQTIDLRTDKSTTVVGKREHGGGAHRSVEHLLFPDVLPKADGRKTHGQDFLRTYWHAPTRRLIVHANGMPEGGVLKSWAPLVMAAFERTLGTGNGVKPIGLTPDGRLIATAWHRIRDLPADVRKHGMDKKPNEHVELATGYNLCDGRATPRVIPGNCKAFTLSPDGTYLAAVSEGQPPAIEIWRVAGGKRLAAIEAERLDINRLCWTPDGSHVVGRVTSEGPDLLVFWTPEGKRAAQIPCHSYLFDISPNGGLVAYGGSTGEKGGAFAEIVDVKTGKRQHRFDLKDGWRGVPRFVDNHRVLVGDSIAADSDIVLYDLRTGEVVWRVKAQGQVRGIRLSAGRKVAVFDHEIYGAGADIRRVADGRRLPEGATAPAWYRPTPIGDGRLVLDPVLGSNIIRLAETATGRTIATFAPFADPDWMIWTPEGLWTGSENALDWVSFYRGGTALSREAVLARRNPAEVQERIQVALKRADLVRQRSRQ